jgi:hypothetical protein
MVYWFVLLLTLMQPALARRRLRTFTDLNLRIVNMLQHLS